MEKTFEMASNVSTALGLGGLFAAVLFLLLRQLIKHNTIPAVSKQIVDRLFFLALISMVLGFIGYILPGRNGPIPIPACSLVLGHFEFEQNQPYLVGLTAIRLGSSLSEAYKA